MTRKRFIRKKRRYISRTGSRKMYLRRRPLQQKAVQRPPAQKATPQQLRKELAGMTLYNDLFMRRFFQDQKAIVQEILRIIIGDPTIIVERMEIQRDVPNLLRQRSGRLDVYAVGKDGKRYNIELQVGRKGASVKRARIQSAWLTMDASQKSMEWEDVPETWVIFITKSDYFGDGAPIDIIQRTRNNKPVGDGEYIVYVNGRHQDVKTALGQLMHDMACKNPEEMLYSWMRDRAHYLKRTEEGMELMYSDIERNLPVLTKYVTKSVTESVTKSVTRSVRTDDAQRVIVSMHGDGVPQSVIESTVMNAFEYSQNAARNLIEKTLNG